MDHKASPYAVTMAALVSVLGCLFLLSLVLLLTRGTPDTAFLRALARPGAFFFESFLLGSFFIPLYLFACAVLLVRRPFSGRHLLLLNLSIVPFLTVSLLLKTVWERRPRLSPSTEMLLEAFGRVPAAILLFLVSSIEILLLVQLAGYLRSRRQRHAGDVAGRDAGEHAAPVDAVPVESTPVESALPMNAAPADPWIDERLEAEPPAAVVAFPDMVPADEPGDPEAAVEPEAVTDPEALVEPTSTKEPEATVEPEALVDPAETVEPAAAMDPPRQAVDSPTAGAGPGPPRRRRYSVPVEGVLQEYSELDYWKIDDQTREAGAVLMKTLEEFNISAELTGIQKGPVITMFEILPSPGVKLSKIVNLADNIALRLAALRVRIVAPIPGKHAVGIEVPNKQRVIVPFKEMITLEKFQKSRYEIPAVLGKDISGVAQIVDLVQTPHLLIAGATGSGKSVCVNSLIASILYSKTPEEVRLMLIDPKIVELKSYNDIPHLLTPVITEPKRSFQALQYCIYEMERRYSLLDNLEVRDIRGFNRKVHRERIATDPLPYIVIFVDEFADLMATSGKEMEATLARLAAMSRAVGIHLVLATQRPSVDVITGLIKANIPSRIAFMVASKFDSRIIIDTVGAEKLLGQGDMLFTSAWDPVPIRIQGAYLADEEIEAVTDHVKSLAEPEYIDEEIFFDEEEGESFQYGEEDPMMDKALDVIVTAGKASASYLQRRLKIGYNRAARLIEHMEMKGIVGPANGSKPREIIHVPDRSERELS